MNKQTRFRCAYCLAILFFTMVTSGPLTASAQDEENSFRMGTLSLDGQASVGGPRGNFGVGVGYSILNVWVIEAGVGVNLSGVQFGATTRVRFPLGTRFALGVEGLFSVGRYEYRDKLIGGSRYTWDLAYWAGGGLSFEGRFSDLGFRAFLGYARIVNPDDFINTCEEFRTCNQPDIDDWGLWFADLDTVYIGGSFVYHVDLL